MARSGHRLLSPESGPYGRSGAPQICIPREMIPHQEESTVNLHDASTGTNSGSRSRAAEPFGTGAAERTAGCSAPGRRPRKMGS
jgi:hypothetical protein